MTNPTPEDILANLKANPHPKQTHLEMAGGFAYITIDTHKIAYDGERWFACGQQITPRFSMNSLHQEIDRVFVLARKIKDHVLDKTTTPTWEQIKADCVGPDLPTEQTFVSTDRYRELESELAKSKDQLYWLSLIGGVYGLPVSNPSKIREEVCKTYNRVSSAETHVDSLRSQLKTMTTSRDELQKKVDITNSQMSDLLAERERLFAQIKALTEERDESQKRIISIKGELSDACAQLDDAGKSIDRLAGECDRLKSKADREELLTVEIAKLQEGIKNYKAQVEGLTKRVEQLAFERDTERVGNKWLSETIEDLKRTTVKLPNEHALRRLFNRHNTPEKYDDGTTIPTIERFLLIIENLCRNADCLERRFEELNAISTRVDTESEDAHALLDEMGIPRWTTVGNHNERNLSLSARIRSVFNTHTKV